MSNTIYCKPGQLCPVPAGTGPATACPRSLAGTDACCEVGRPNTCVGQSGTCPQNNHNFVWTKCPSVKCPANGVCPGGRVPDPNSCEKKFNCSQETKCCGFGKDGKGCDPSITTEDQCNALCSSNGRENCWHDPGSKPGSQATCDLGECKGKAGGEFANMAACQVAGACTNKTYDCENHDHLFTCVPAAVGIQGQYVSHAACKSKCDDVNEATCELGVCKEKAGGEFASMAACQVAGACLPGV